MPIYEYRCMSCHQTVETIQKLNDPPLTKCEACKGKLEKIVSRTAFHLKGGGWFDQGYSGGSPSGSSDSGSDSGSSSDSGAVAGSGSDSKEKSKGKAKPKAKSEASSKGSDSKPPSGGCGSGSCGCAN